MYVAALDIGGTKTIAAILNCNGKVLAQEKFESVISDYRKHLSCCVRSMKRLMLDMGLSAEDFAGAGVSLPGIVDNETGVLIYAPHANWKNIEVAKILAEGTGIKNIKCENDVNACAIGEQRFGLGSKYSDYVWMTVSTGVGGAVVENSKLVRGGQGFAGELGHLKVEYKLPASCPCGQYGCLEAHGSGTALIRETRKRRLESPSFAKALEDKGLTADGIGCAALARSGNREALEIMDRIGMYLGRGIACCINVLNPQAVIVGGGVAESLDLLLPSIRNAVQQNAFIRLQDVDIIKTPLGYEAALLGAAALVSGT